MTTINDLTFGIEIETVKRTREQVATTIQTVVGGTILHLGGHYDAWAVFDGQGREWKVVSDSSLTLVDKMYQSEVVSPILTYADLPQLQEVARALYNTGSRIDRTCGIHVHVGAQNATVKGLVNLTKLVYKQENLMFEAMGVDAVRKEKYCQPVSSELIAKLERTKPKSREDLNRVWYGHYNPSPEHYDTSRYHGFNMHNVFFRNTIEFRYFNSTLHAGRIKAYVQFCLCLFAKAMNANSASAKQTALTESAKYDFRVFLLKLGMIGDEYKTARLHLTQRLAGSSSRKYHRAA
ncbi:MAG: amidoligase family protein [Deltaproteobacteria bacterium]|jgi:hypothetical protein|nr:amidoligase family protein [Deltaproteobacteria bacterium]